MANNHMNKKECTTELARMAAALQVQPRKTTIDDATFALRRAAKILHEIGILECNGVMQRDGYMGWTEDDQKRADARREKAERRVRNTFTVLFGDAMSALRVEFQGDPRGPSVNVYMAGDTSGQRRIATFW